MNLLMRQLAVAWMDDVAYTVGVWTWTALAVACAAVAWVGVPLLPFDRIIFSVLAVPFVAAALASVWWDRWGRAQYAGDLTMLADSVNAQELQTMADRLNMEDDE